MADENQKPGSRQPGKSAQEAEAQRILQRIERESESVATSSMARSASGFRKHLSGHDGTSDDEDPIEVLGKRIGRSLGFIAVAILLIYLFVTYVMK